MCDTMVCLPSVTKNGNMIFAKNSDRSPNEPHIIERVQAQDHDIINKPKVQTTYISIDQVKHTYAVTLFKPSWIWGAEMGFNEHGVNIGNEAVFTKSKGNKQEKLIGMDFLRLALERSRTAYEALFLITDLLAKYGQGGNCGYDKKFYYDNSYLIADGREAYVLETAGEFWAAQKVKDIYAISNGLTIEGDFDYAHPFVTSERESNSKYSFTKAFREPIFTYFSKSKDRRSCALDFLNSQLGKIEVKTLMHVLRSHKHGKKDVSSVGSICMHAGGMIGDHTTGSYVVEYTDKGMICYATGASLPCYSLYKPLLQEYLDGDCTNKGVRYWYQREVLTRFFLSGQVDPEKLLKQRDSLELKMLKDIKAAKTSEDIEKIIIKFTNTEQKIVEKQLNATNTLEYEFCKGSLLYRRFWNKKTEIMLEEMTEMLK